MIITLILFVLFISVAFVIKFIFKLKDEIEKYILNSDLHYKDIHHELECVQINLSTEIAHLECLIFKRDEQNKGKSTDHKKITRSEEQKKQASLKRKQWWDQKKKREQKTVPPLEPTQSLDQVQWKS